MLTITSIIGNIFDDKKLIVIEQLPEKVISIKIKNLKDNQSRSVTLGHIIGNRHKPIVINDDVLSFPIQAESEVEVFKKLLSGVMNNLELKVEEQIFQPQHRTYMHEH